MVPLSLGYPEPYKAQYVPVLHFAFHVLFHLIPRHNPMLCYPFVPGPIPGEGVGWAAPEHERAMRATRMPAADEDGEQGNCSFQITQEQLGDTADEREDARAWKSLAIGRAERRATRTRA